MKKILALVLALCMILVLCACGTTTPAADEDASAAEPADEGMKVAMITDYGDITDQSFNQTTYEACKEYCEENDLEFNYYKPDGDSTADRVAMVDKAVADGFNVLVMPGYAFAGTIVESAEMYPDVKFVALDVAAGDLLAEALGDKYDYDPSNWDVEDYYHSDNVYCAVYQEELSGYMAGYAAVKMGYTKLGFLGGMAVPAVIRYGYGFVQGADDAAAESDAEVEINYAYGNQFFGDADITAAMDTWYKAGTEVVFACGGGIFSSAAEAAQKVDGKVIGVDVDQAATIDEKYGDGMTVTSAMKGLAATVDSVLSQIADGDWKKLAGKIETLGMVSEDDPEANFVQLPIKSTQWNDTFTEEDYEALVADIYNGDVKVSDDISAEEPPAKNVTVNFQGNIK